MLFDSSEINFYIKKKDKVPKYWGSQAWGTFKFGSGQGQEDFKIQQ